MAMTNSEGTMTMVTREDETAAIRTALANVLGEAAGDLDATAAAVVAEMNRIAMVAYEDHRAWKFDGSTLRVPPLVMGR